MRLKNYLTEIRRGPGFSLNDVMPEVAKDCAPYLKKLKKSGRFLYTGRQISEISVKKKVRKDRRPMDTPEEIHNILNDIFEDRFGVKARSQSIFASVDKEQTSFYGYPYYLFPTGRNYKLIGSNQIRDLYTQISNELKKEYDDVLSVSLFMEEVEALGGEFKEEVMAYIEKVANELVGKYDMDQEMDRTDGDGEVMVVADSVWLVSAFGPTETEMAQGIGMEV